MPCVSLPCVSVLRIKYKRARFIAPLRRIYMKAKIFTLATTALLLTACGKQNTPEQPSAVTISVSAGTSVVAEGESVTLTVTVTPQNTGFDWPVISADEGTLTPINDSQSVFTPRLPRTLIEKTHEITVRVSADSTKSSTARVTVYFPAEQAFYLGINNSGEVIGEFHDDGINVRAFVKDGDDYTALYNPDASGNIYVYGINDSGHILGSYENGYFLKIGDDYHDLVNYPGAYYTHYTGINNSGLLSGYFANAAGYASGFVYFVYDGGFEVIDHPDAAGCTQSRCGTFITAINDSGHTAGYFVDSNGIYRGFVNDGNSPPITINFPGYSSADVRVEGINDSGQAVGWFFPDSGMTAAGFVFTLDSGDFEIISHPDAASDGYGVYVYGINDSGRIVGWFDSGEGARGFSMN